MRDIVLTLIVFGSLPFILRRPYIGILVWSWLSYMNPHRLTYGFAYSLPYAQIVAFTLIVAVLFNKEKWHLPKSSVIPFWIIFLFWMCLSTVFALNQEPAVDQLIKIFKIQLLTFITLLVINDLYRIRMLIWTIVLSIGFYSVKGGVFTILSAGAHRVYGPPGSFIEENNGLALATLMIIPLMFYLYTTLEKKWHKLGMMGAIVLSFASVLGSQSRGALVAIIAVGLFFWLKSSSKLVSAIFIVTLACAGWAFMPQSWHDRMNTIENYEEDASAQGRINAWMYSINVANDRLTGGGLESWTKGNFAIYAPNPDDAHVAHSIYFSALGDHGWPGLVLFMTIIALTWKNLAGTVRKTAEISEQKQQNLLARMLQISLIAWMSGGAFLSLTYFDLPWHIIVLAIVLPTTLVQSASVPLPPPQGRIRAY